MKGNSGNNAFTMRTAQGVETLPYVFWG